MERPVKCHFCKEPMYYANDPRHVPEVRIDIVESDRESGEYYYAHKKCCHKFFIGKRFLFKKRSNSLGEPLLRVKSDHPVEDP